MADTAPATILLVEDEPSLAEAIRYTLEKEGLRVVVAADGRRGLMEFRAAEPSLVLLDLMLPQLPGLDLCKAIRSDSNVPIIMLTAKDSEADKVAGLELGADDYMTKPFSMRELVSRVRAQLRRARMAEQKSHSATSELASGNVALDRQRHEVRLNGQVMPMTPKEFMLLELLLDKRGKLLTRDFLIDEVWGPSYVGDTKTLDVHVKRLREKIEEDPRNPKRLLTVRGLGYKFVG